MNTQHHNLAKGKWHQLTLPEQMGNIGSEVGRTFRWLGRDEKVAERAAERALELFDFTLQDPRWSKRLREIARTREIFCDVVFGGNQYQSKPEDLERYFLSFAILARRK